MAGKKKVKEEVKEEVKLDAKIVDILNYSKKKKKLLNMILAQKLYASKFQTAFLLMRLMILSMW